MNCTRGMCARSVDIVNCAVRIGTHPDRKAARTRAPIKRVRHAVAEVL
ncbi:MAG: hypothetical protein HPY69_16865 [Armatimonadetes bacterium]|nr:hypothetical protein [Armatimonadota bacterium]